jgi:hypothetical protein
VTGGPPRYHSRRARRPPGLPARLSDRRVPPPHGAPSALQIVASDASKSVCGAGSQAPAFVAGRGSPRHLRRGPLCAETGRYAPALARVRAPEWPSAARLLRTTTERPLARDRLPSRACTHPKAAARARYRRDGVALPGPRARRVRRRHSHAPPRASTALPSRPDVACRLPATAEPTPAVSAKPFLAEREGFEPSNEVDPRYAISSRARSTAPAPLQAPGSVTAQVARQSPWASACAGTHGPRRSVRAARRRRAGPARPRPRS